MVLLLLCQFEKALDLHIVHTHVLHEAPPFHLLARQHGLLIRVTSEFVRFGQPLAGSA